MQALYRKLVEVDIRHDFFLLPGAGEKYATGYNSAALVSIVPTTRTARLMRDHRMLLKQTPAGFTLFIQAGSIPSTSTYVSLVDGDPGMALSFQWVLNDPLFVNYTNHRLIEKGKHIYYFSNRSASVTGTQLYLNQAIPAFGTTYYSEPAYRLGDIVQQGGETWEMIEKESPAINFAANIAKWQKINTGVVHFVNPADRLSLQTGGYRHQRNNTTPGEYITFLITDMNAQEVPFKPIPGTSNQPDVYRTSLVATEAVDYTLPLDHLPPGKYTLTIQEIAGTTVHPFYIPDTAASQGALLAVSELFITGAAAPFRFFAEDPGTKRWPVSDTPKSFRVRFRNRLTRWKYFKQDNTLFHQAPAPRALSKTYSGYQITVLGEAIDLPDPTVHPIVPDVDAATQLIKNIYSPIYLIK